MVGIAWPHSWKWRGKCRTVKPEVVAQALSPAVLMIAPLSTWPEPTRLQRISVYGAEHDYGVSCGEVLPLPGVDISCDRVSFTTAAPRWGFKRGASQEGIAVTVPCHDILLEFWVV